MSEEKAKKLLEKYLDGNASSEEQEQVNNWYARLDAGKAALAENQRWAIRDSMLRQVQLATTGKIKSKLIFNTNWIKIAAAIVLMASVSFLFWKLNMPQPVVSTQVLASAGVGEHKKIILSDGSEITLSPLAKISYPKHFETNSRKIILIEGEAFFAIAHDVKRPFQVKLPANLNIAVLGTSFLIRAYAAKAKVEIAVSTGKVAIRKHGTLLGTLVKNQQLQFDKITGKTKILPVSHVSPVAIAFNGATLSAVIKQISYVYQVNVLLPDVSLANLKTTATFSSAQRPEEIIDIVCSLHHLRFSSDQNHQTFKIYK